MPVTRFPTPSTPNADLARTSAVARPLALSVRFRGQPADAVRWALAASPVDVDAALAADDALTLIRARRALRRALRAGDMATVHRLRPIIARLYVSIRDVARRHRIAGWHQ